MIIMIMMILASYNLHRTSSRDHRLTGTSRGWTQKMRNHRQLASVVTGTFADVRWSGWPEIVLS